MMANIAFTELAHNAVHALHDKAITQHLKLSGFVHQLQRR